METVKDYENHVHDNRQPIPINKIPYYKCVSAKDTTSCRKTCLEMWVLLHWNAFCSTFSLRDQELTVMGRGVGQNVILRGL